MRKASKHKPTFRVPDAPNLQYEHELAASNFSLVAGLDEAGRGAWAGVRVSAAVFILSWRKQHYRNWQAFVIRNK